MPERRGEDEHAHHADDEAGDGGSCQTSSCSVKDRLRIGIQTDKATSESICDPVWGGISVALVDIHLLIKVRGIVDKPLSPYVPYVAAGR
ncbi:MAG: hypothetical protein ACYSU0_02135 [Planctomycetota bacterium]|jgi:hypothetical protein